MRQLLWRQIGRHLAFDWLLLASGVVLVVAILAAIADSRFHSDGSVLYWYLVLYAYPDGNVFAILFGLLVIALALALLWAASRLLLDAGLLTGRALAVHLLMVLASFGLATMLGVLALLALFNTSAAAWSSPNGWLYAPVALVSGSVAAILAYAVWRLTRGVRHAAVRAFILVALSIFAALTIAPAALLYGERPQTYTHLTSATANGQIYRLTLMETPSDGQFALLYECDGLGLWCSEIDRIGSGQTRSDNGHLTLDQSSHRVTATDDGRPLMSYPLDALFSLP